MLKKPLSYAAVSEEAMRTSCGRWSLFAQPEQR